MGGCLHRRLRLPRPGSAVESSGPPDDGARGRHPDAGPCACGRAVGFTQANVVVISIDTLHRDHLAPYGAPFETAAASRLAGEGVVFEHAVSQVPLTLPSHASLFTGLYPPHHAGPRQRGLRMGPDTTTLAERFQAAGYRTAGFVASYVLHSRWGLGQGHETYDDSFTMRGSRVAP